MKAFCTTAPKARPGPERGQAVREVVNAATPEIIMVADEALKTLGFLLFCVLALATARRLTAISVERAKTEAARMFEPDPLCHLRILRLFSFLRLKRERATRLRLRGRRTACLR
ncbi:MAG: hypothetical protein WBX25_27995 [Rhodomicrobium sp.]